jgi:regulator of nucleoside diphosphate kinase
MALQKTLEGSTSPGPALLAAEIARLSVVDPKEQAAFVKIGSRVTYRDLQRPGVRTGRLLMPADIGPQEDCISLMAPVGAALLGLSVDDVFEWEVQGKPRSVRVLEIRG